MAEPAHTAVLQGVRTQYHESLQNVSSVMRSGAELIRKSSNNSGTLYRIENYVGLRIESIGKILCLRIVC